jgi:hypothetical protein
MAVLLRLTVAPATQEQFHSLDERVGEAMGVAGGPPAGLMSHVVHPEGDGFVVADVWRSEADGRGYVEGELRRLLGEVGLPPGVVEALPVWSFAKP